ncbi:MAG TPA: N-acetylneuraminate synthase family protein [Candidatus Omnitrophota bacterium]|nr:N-acetylneuraminate synthase family protein [Candidatus Omnitrophota bacterium]
MNNKAGVLTVGRRKIGPGYPAFVIAEIGCNFEGNLDRAKEMIANASLAGVDAVKFQTFTAEKITTRSARKFWEIEGCPGQTQYEEFLQMPRLSFKEYGELKDTARRHGIIFFSSPEDEGSCDILEKVGVPLYKISSMNITHFPLIEHVARKRKPVIISTGASSIAEIREALSVVRKTGNGKVALLHCITNYPTKDKDVNLNMITHLKKAFPGLVIGYSDHTLPEDGEGIITAAVALGANIIEKHFTFDNKRPGYDHAISADYKGLKHIVAQIRRAEEAFGEEYKRPIGSEKKARVHARRSLVAARHISKGSVISRDMIDVKRPGTGIEPRYLEAVIGKAARVEIEDDSVLRWNMIKNGRGAGK